MLCFNISTDQFKANGIVNNFLLTRDKSMPGQPVFTYSARQPFTKHHGRIKKFKETGDLNSIYKNELDGACFSDNAVYADQYLAKRTISDVLKDRMYEIALSPRYDGCQ